MNEMTERVKYWEFLHHLIDHEGMKILYIKEDDDTAWIEDDRHKQPVIIRLTRKNFDWSNQLKADIDIANRNSKEVKRHFNIRSGNVINVILSQVTPVDDYEHYLSSVLPLTAGGKNQFRTLLITMDQLQDRMFPLATEWKLKDTPVFTPSEALEEEGLEAARIQKLQRDIQRLTNERTKQDMSLFQQGKPRLTILLIGIIAAIFVWMETVGSTTSTLTLVEFGAKYDPAILDGEWWRFVSAMFIHIGPLHLFMNSLALFFLGAAVERIFGTGRFFGIYFLAGLFGSVASFVFNDNISAGASGAIFGLFGALLYFGVRHKKLFFRTMGMNILVILGINLVFGFVVPMVDNGAHIGGLIGGFIASSIVGLPAHKKDKSMIGAFLTAVILMAGLLLAGYNQDLDDDMLASINFQIAGEWIELEEYSKAEPYLLSILSNSESDIQESDYVNSYFFLSYVQLQQDNLADAEESLQETIRLRPDFHEAHYNLALVYMEKDEMDRALDSAQQALSLVPENEDYQSLVNELEQR
ncbi:Rhomboid protease [[Bacillus] selenitireducens MLS10]|uniref:Rhomboid protease n=2 Tax=Salisediminibacterium selenitireducens TaxID=85683 RepID=D6XW59_BACIE|nr:Rhomboid protease [[Bacillus] selenitireducens MLS10]